MFTTGKLPKKYEETEELANARQANKKQFEEFHVRILENTLIDKRNSQYVRSKDGLPF